MLEFGVVQGGHDQEHGVSPHQTGVGHVGGADGEVFPQHWQPAGRPGPAQVGRRSPEELSVGQHRQTGGPTGLVVPGHDGGVKAGVEIAA